MQPEFRHGLLDDLDAQDVLQPAEVLGVAGVKGHVIRYGGSGDQQIREPPRADTTRGARRRKDPAVGAGEAGSRSVHAAVTMAATSSRSMASGSGTITR